MSQEDNKKVDNRSWLFKQSSELEMLISAAIIFTALQISDVISKGIISLINSNFAFNSPILGVLAIVGLYMSTLLPISIVAHFLLRIFWLSLVGLHSAFPGKDQVDSTYVERFGKVINNSLNLEKQIHQLDKLSSSIFAFSFLTLFSFCFPFITLSALVYLIHGIKSVPGLNNLAGEVLTYSLEIGLLLAFGLYIVDFITFGRFKKIKSQRFQRFYFPVYKIVSGLSLAFVYRGIFYKLSTNVSKKVVSLIIIAYLLLGIFFLNAGYHVYELYPSYQLSGSLGGSIISGRHYSDKIDADNVVIDPFINSFVIKKGKNHVELNFPLSFYLEDSLLSQCAGIKKFNTRGMHWRQWFTLYGLNVDEHDSTFIPAKNAAQILRCFKDKMQISIDDSVRNELTFYYAMHSVPKKAVLRTYIPIHSLTTGDHIIRIESDQLYGKYKVLIPFLKD